MFGNIQWTTCTGGKISILFTKFLCPIIRIFLQTLLAALNFNFFSHSMEHIFKYIVRGKKCTTLARIKLLCMKNSENEGLAGN